MVSVNFCLLAFFNCNFWDLFDLLIVLHIDRVGLDLVNGTIRDNKKAGVLEPTMSKIKCLKFATEAAITILRIDDMVKLEPDKKDDANSYEAARRAGRI